MKRLFRYLRVFLLHTKSSLMIALEYRIGFVTALGMSLIDALWAVGGAWVFYSHRPTLGGWQFHETLIVIGLFLIASGFLDMLLQPNLQELSESIRTGRVDYLLSRPLDVMIHASMQRQRFEKIANVLVGLAMVGFSLARCSRSLPLEQFLLFLWLLGVSTMFLYALVNILMAACFWATEFTNVEDFLFGILETARYPVHAFPEPLRSILSFVIPIAVVSTVPAEALLGRSSTVYIFYGSATTLTLLLISRLMWQAALRKHSGAGN